MNSADPQEKDHIKPSWGLLPTDVTTLLRQKQWDNIRNLKRLLKGEKAFPLQIALKPPSGNTILNDINHFQTFISTWQTFSTNKNNSSCEVIWEKRGFRHLSEQDIPIKLNIHNIGALAYILGEQAVQTLNTWQTRIAYVLNTLPKSPAEKCFNENQQAKEKALFITLIDHLETLNKFNDSELNLLIQLIPQLKRGMGNGGYLRSLPVTFVDTKFIENNLKIIESIATATLDETIADNGLLCWLDCQDKPKDWLLIRPLCDQTKAALGGVPLLRLSSDTLLKFALPAENILIIENEQPCLALPHIPMTIAIAGGGKNVAWMKATWLNSKRVAYWGDIDSEGFSILSDARSKLSTIKPLMMDTETVKAYKERMVEEPDSVTKTPIALTQDEQNLFNALRAKKYVHTRLEQERLPMDYVETAICAWLG